MNSARIEPVGLLIISLALLTSCGKDDEQTQPSGGTPWMNHLELSLDSACVLAPNVFTPNFDGINDRFVVVGSNMASLNVEVRNSQNTIVFTSDDLSPMWDGTDSTGTGPYSVLVSGTTMSGVFLSGQSSLTALDYNGALCLTYAGDPVAGDQFDPRICGVTYPSNDIFCE
jgi:hypothetical protein